MYRRFLAVAASAAVVVTLLAGPALAEHDHFIVTPNGQCHQVAAGQTAIVESLGGYHRFHANVHLGATEDDDNKILGHGRAAVEVYKGADAPEICS